MRFTCAEGGILGKPDEELFHLLNGYFEVILQVESVGLKTR